MSMLNALDTVYNSGLNTGALGSVTGRSREQQALDKAEALAKGRAAGTNGDVDSKLRGVAEEFVSVFMNQVMKSMRATVDENPAMHGDNGEKFFQEMLDTEQSKTLAKGSGYGLTDLIYEALVKKSRITASPSPAEAETAVGEVEM